MDVAQTVLAQLDECRPEWVRNEVKLVSVGGLPGSIFGLVSLSARLKQDGDPNLLAFAMAHGLASDLLVRILRGSVDWSEPSLAKLEGLPEWLGLALAAPLSAVGFGASIIGTTVEIGTFERESIRRATTWAAAAGFDPRAGARYFSEGFTPLRDYVEPKPTWKNTALRAALKPSEFVMHRIRTGPEAFLSNAERAEFVEEICAELGI